MARNETLRKVFLSRPEKCQNPAEMRHSGFKCPYSERSDRLSSIEICYEPMWPAGSSTRRHRKMIAGNTGGSLEPLMKYREVAAYLGVDRRTLVHWVKEGIVPSVSIGHGSRRFVRADIERFVREGRQEGGEVQ